MKRLGWILSIGGLLLWLLAKPVLAQDYPEYISLFDAKITVNDDASILIRETINYHTQNSRHGIYRTIPISYRRGGIRYTTKLNNIVVSEADGSPIPYEESIADGFLKLKIGDPNSTFTGNKTYIIAYTTTKALQQFEAHDELYWDITGEGWQIPILRTQATIDSPPAQIFKVDCYSGVVGGDDKNCRTAFDQNSATFLYDSEIDYGKNMTVVVGFARPNAIGFPTEAQKRWQNFRDNWPLLFIPLPALIAAWWWFLKGRDMVFLSPNVFNTDQTQPKKRQTLFFSKRTPFVYEPLKVTPGEAGVLLDEKADNQDVVAEIIDLARKKYLKIEALELKGLFRKSTDYRFVEMKPADSRLPEQQKYLMEHLFAASKTVLVSKLKGTFYTEVEEIKKILDQNMAKHNLFFTSPRSTRITAVVLALMASGAMFSPSLFTELTAYSAWPYILAGLQLPFTLLFAYNLPARTALGSNLWMQAKGLQQTIRYGKWREEIKEKNLFIEEILPFAVALGVVSRLARDMEKLNLKPPQYFSGQSSAMNFNNLMHSFTTTTASTLSHNPSSSSWSSGSGFSGGSSGGGGGGGGGGSW